MKRVMFDVETMSTQPNAAVIAVAVAMADDRFPEHVSARAWFIDPNTAIGHRDPSTIAWWGDQDPRIHSVVWGGKQTPLEAFREMNSFVAANLVGISDQSIICYADPSNFDFPIIKNQLIQLGMLPTWHWRSERCLGSIKRELKEFGFPVLDFTPPEEEKHHPLHDCLYQLKEVRALVDLLTVLKHPAQVAV